MKNWDKWLRYISTLTFTYLLIFVIVVIINFLFYRDNYTDGFKAGVSAGYKVGFCEGYEDGKEVDGGCSSDKFEEDDRSGKCNVLRFCEEYWDSSGCPESDTQWDDESELGDLVEGCE